MKIIITWLDGSKEKINKDDCPENELKALFEKYPKCRLFEGKNVIYNMEYSRRIEIVRDK